MKSGLYEQQTQVLMKLRVYCSRYRRYTPQKLSSQSGSLRFNIPNYMLENFDEEGFTIKEISGIIYMSERAPCRRMNQYNLSKISFTNDSDACLDKKCMRYVSNLLTAERVVDEQRDNSAEIAINGQYPSS